VAAPHIEQSGAGKARVFVDRNPESTCRLLREWLQLILQSSSQSGSLSDLSSDMPFVRPSRGGVAALQGGGDTLSEKSTSYRLVDGRLHETAHGVSVPFSELAFLNRPPSPLASPVLCERRHRGFAPWARSRTTVSNGEREVLL
jgi:hypothetical protein